MMLGELLRGMSASRASLRCTWNRGWNRLPSGSLNHRDTQTCGVHTDKQNLELEQEFDAIDAMPLEDIKAQFRSYQGGNINLQIDYTTQVGYIQISHPERRNAISGSMMASLNDIMHELSSWARHGKGLILMSDNTGQPDPAKRTFCAGGDMHTNVQIANPTDGYKMARLAHDTLIHLRKLPLVSACLLNGRALGGGAELALYTDFLVFTQHASMAFIQANVGVATGWGGGCLLRERVGAKNALNLLLTCQTIGPEAALNIKLCDLLLQEDNDIEALANFFAQNILRFDRTVSQAAKKILYHNPDHLKSLERDLQFERRQFARLWGGDVNKRILDTFQRR